MNPELAGRLRAIGREPDAFGDPADAWRQLRERFGAVVTIIDRYALEAVARGVGADQLDAETRSRIQVEVLHVQFPDMELIPGSERRDGAIRVEPYDRTWPARFAGWRDRLRAELGSVAVRIEHVGSTAVPGLAAKPIVDIQVSVPDVEDEAAFVPAIERAGMQLRAREPGHRYFRPPADRPRDVHLHVCNAASAWERDHLLFRDDLRRHTDAREAYAALKRELSERYPDDRLAYTEAKSEFILDALAAARAQLA